ncbi:GNAT family N-acetyltransferase [Paracraurococcus lichenis]|uniref:GNAT family N-acetyltransferase n=1 Tax=Paracraurococcus lichenis TaxID=3064888 RepID=A0ABT9E874_9PROT|nr:GNAT family N-acetyltransferase [Paracraurococcus sp. LOR1-02]MDO9712155.1 GNAT family N-acetyltransferase [Paracraurococcus sp. LOR1-02]
MHDIAALERACLTALPALRHAWDGPFVLKAYLGGTGRANACCSLDPSPDPALAARIGRIAATYHRLGLPSRFRSTPLDPPGLAEALLAAGHAIDKEDSIVFAGPAAPVARADAAVRDEGGPGEAWTALIATAEYQTPARRAEKLRNPELLAAPGAWLVLREDGVDAACLFAVADGAHCGIFDLATRPEFRRRGLGARLIRAAAHWAQGLGAQVLYAQVAEGNAASRGLQESLGLREAYRYRYYVRAAAG